MSPTEPDFREQLHDLGFRATPERIHLLSILWHAKNPLTVDELGRRLDCNVVTLYRMLNDLRKTGLIVRGVGAAGAEGDQRGDTRAAHFLYAKKHRHHHLVCVDCGFKQQCAVCS